MKEFSTNFPEFNFERHEKSVWIFPQLWKETLTFKRAFISTNQEGQELSFFRSRAKAT